MANLIGGALRPDAVSLRCVQFALLWNFQRARTFHEDLKEIIRFGARVWPKARSENSKSHHCPFGNANGLPWALLGSSTFAEILGRAAELVKKARSLRRLHS